MNKGIISLFVLIAIIIGAVAVTGVGTFYVATKFTNKEKPTASEDDKLVVEDPKGNETSEEPQSERIVIQRIEVPKDNGTPEELKKELDSLRDQLNAQQPVLAPLVESKPPPPPSVLSKAEIIKKVKTAVVYIDAGDKTGSGMIIDPAGYVLTNAHVVENVKNVEIKTSDGSSHSATVTGRNKDVDIAVLKMDSGSGFSTVEFGDSDTVEPGDDIYAMGFPFGFAENVSFTGGVYSRPIKQSEIQYMEASVAIHPGNSGGPLVDRRGTVVGINSAIYGYSLEGADVIVGESIKLALPINIVKKYLPNLKGVSFVSEECRTLVTYNSEFNDWYDGFAYNINKAFAHIKAPTSQQFTSAWLKQRKNEYRQKLDEAEMAVRVLPARLPSTDANIISIRDNMLYTLLSMRNHFDLQVEALEVLENYQYISDEIGRVLNKLNSSSEKINEYGKKMDSFATIVRNTYKETLSSKSCGL